MQTYIPKNITSNFLEEMYYERPRWHCSLDRREMTRSRALPTRPLLRKVTFVKATLSSLAEIAIKYIFILALKLLAPVHLSWISVM